MDIMEIIKPVVDDEYRKEIEKARRYLRAFILDDKKCAPIMLRLAFNDAGTYCKNTYTGGPNGSIRHHDELKHKANKGLEIAVDLFDQIKTKFPLISFADLYQLAGIVAVEIHGGPTIDFTPGRKDSYVCSKEGRLPDPNGDASHLRDKFYRMGLYDKDIAALSGAHTLLRAHADRSGDDGAWTKKPFVFDNSYFVELFKKNSEGRFKLPSDLALLKDSGLRHFASKYAEDEELFLKNYAAAHKKMSELGVVTIRALPVCKEVEETSESCLVVAQRVAGVVIAAMVVIVGCIYASRKMKVY